MLKFHSDMAKHKSQGNKSCWQYYTVLASLQVFKIGFLNEIQVHTHHDLALYFLKVKLFL